MTDSHVFLTSRIKATISKIEEYHDEWYNHLDAFMRSLRSAKTALRSTKPAIYFYVGQGTKKFCGRYHMHDITLVNHYVVYGLPQAMLDVVWFNEVVAHEMCHAFAKHSRIESKWHGDLHNFLMHQVCDIEDSDATMCVEVISKFGKLLRLILKDEPVHHVYDNLATIRKDHRSNCKAATTAD